MRFSRLLHSLALVVTVGMALLFHPTTVEPLSPKAVPAATPRSTPGSTPAAMALPLTGGASATPAQQTNATLIATINQVEDSKFPSGVAYVSVTDESGSPINGLTGANFELFEDGQPLPQFAVTTTIDTEQQIAVSLVLDVSGSMQGKSLDYTQQGAINFMDVLGPRDAVQLVSFSSVVKVNVPFTTTKAIVGQGITNLRAGGDTALYDAVGVAVQTMRQRGPGRKLTVLLTDGEDTASKTRFDQLMTLLTAARVPVFTVGLGEGVDHKVLDQIAAQSGGRSVYAPSANDLMRAYRTVADQLRAQHAISFASSLPADNGEHKLLVRVKHPSGIAEAQGSFVAHPNQPWIDVVWPKAGQVITATTQIEVNAAAASAAARITKVAFAVDGAPLSQSAAPPFSATLVPAGLVPGRHVLGVAVYDSASNSASVEIDFTVAPAAKPPPAPTPTAVPTPTPEPAAPVVPEPAFPTMQMIAGVAAALLTGGTLAGIVMVKRRSKPQTCPRCGTFYGYRRSCPTCDLEERRWLLQRLGKVTRQKNEDGDPPE